LPAVWMGRVKPGNDASFELHDIVRPVAETPNIR
jgi:hypothetical protein